LGARVHCFPTGRRAPFSGAGRTSFNPSRPARPALEENNMRDVIFILLTLAIFAVLALIARGVERM
jgi:hypothetical protein